MKSKIKMRIWASKELLKRHLLFSGKNIVEYKKNGIKRYYNKELSWDKEIQEEMIKECVDICSSIKSSPDSKRAGRVLLDLMMGKANSNNVLDGIAVVTERNDALVRKWKKSVLNKYSNCVSCGSDKSLQAHHISQWSDDPINRINLDNGVALCAGCHAKQHPELHNLILSKQNRKHT